MSTTLCTTTAEQHDGLNRIKPIKNHQGINAAVIGIFLSGTGATLSPDNYEHWQILLHRLPPDFIFDNSSAKTPSLDVRSPIDHLTNIFNVLDISVSDLADTLSVSRQTIYKWRDGSIPDDDKQKRIIVLSHVADKIKNAQVSRADTLLKMRAFQGQSFLMLFKEGKEESRYIEELIKEAKVMESAIANSGLRKNPASPHNDWQATDSIPGNVSET